MDDTHPNGMDAKILNCMETSQMPGQQSDYLIVVMKPVKAGGVKGVKNKLLSVSETEDNTRGYHNAK